VQKESTIPQNEQEDRPVFESLRIAVVFSKEGNHRIHFNETFLIDFSDLELYLLKVTLLNFLSGPVFLFYHCLFNKAYYGERDAYQIRN